MARGPSTRRIWSLSTLTALLDGLEERGETMLGLVGVGQAGWPVAQGWSSDCVWQLDRGIEGIASALRGRRNLLSLAIIGLGIGDEGARALSALTGLTSLHLDFNGIGEEGARALSALTGLTSLNLGANNIGDEGARALSALTGLTSLHLAGNSIGDEGARTLSALTGLTSLDLDFNGIGDEGARALSALTGLTSLHLGANSIGDEGARALSALTGLTSLHLGANRIGDQGARALSALTGLTSLHLGANRIGDQGVNSLLAELTKGDSRIRHLDLTGNAATLLPKDVLESRDGRAILAAFRRYAGTREQLEPLNEAKLLVVGNEAVGKTSLIRYLVKGEPCNPHEPETPGIRTHEKIATETWSPTTQGCRLNVWDFGGQEMMHGTHKYFLTERSLYLLVLEDRRKDDRSVHEWLRVIANRGGKSPVIIAINKADEDGQDGTRQQLRLDETRLRAEWPVVVDIVRTSCATGDHARRTIEQLRTKIVGVIDEHPHLAHVRDAMPTKWRIIKDAIAAQARDQKVLEHYRFQRMCETLAGIDDVDEQRALLRLLHDLGVVIAHGLRRGATATVREITLLDPNWLTGAIYTVLNHRRVGEQGGVFSADDLHYLLDPKQYPEERHAFVLEMMQHEDVALCFPLPGSEGRRFLIPEALPRDSPNYDDWPEDALRFRYEYELLPPGLMPRFIVEAHQKLAKGATRWRTGAMFSAAGCRVLATADPARDRIDLRVAGPPGRRRSALNVIVDDLERVHQLNPEARPKAVVPLPDEPEVSVSYAHLLRLEALKGLDHEFLPDGGSREYSVRELLEGVRQDRRLPDGPRMASHLNVYDGGTVVIAGRDMDHRMTSTKITNKGQMQGVAVNGSTASANHATQTTQLAAEATHDRELDRDQFERDVAEILTLLVDAKEELEGNYQTIRAALRKLNTVDIEQAEAVSSLHAKLDELLTPQEKSVLRKIADARGAVAANLVSSGIWQYAIAPVIGGLG